MTLYVQVHTTVPSKKTAEKVAATLLNRRLSPCVQIMGPIESRYWWKGNVERSREWLCMIKARRHDFPLIQACIKRIHPYEIPEILTSPILDGNPDYLTWIAKETSPSLRRAIHGKGRQ